MTRRCPPGSTPGSRGTPGRRSWRPRSPRASRRASGGMRRSRPRGSAGRWRSRTRRATRRCPAARRRGRRGGRGHRHGPAQEEGRRRRRDGARHPLDEDRPGQEGLTVATCPSGHESASDDFCDVCGVLIGAAPSLGPGLAADSGAAVAGSGMAGAARPAAPGRTARWPALRSGGPSPARSAVPRATASSASPAAITSRPPPAARARRRPCSRSPARPLSSRASRPGRPGPQPCDRGPPGHVRPLASRFPAGRPRAWRR